MLFPDIKEPNFKRREARANIIFAIAEPATAAALAPAVEQLGRLVGSAERRALSSVPLADWRRHQSALQGRETWATFGNWIDRHNPRFGFEVADNFLRGAAPDRQATFAHLPRGPARC